MMEVVQQTEYSTKSNLVYRIEDDIEFQPGKNIIRHIASKSTKKVEPLLSKLLTYLINKPFQPITRDELKDTFWAAEVYSDETLTKAISKLRKLLAPHDCIQTLSKVGYEWTGNVTEITTPIPLFQQQIQRFLLNKTSIWVLILVIILLLILKGFFFPHH
ncbi:winged helix-turn-helix domain-containing protein [Fulvivirga lutea]|uniref:Winged helix-turn-helix domain-containing protein n=1 Tax=Fulvivirga lutea TaxID=2810512 RepID=A0A974WMA5_9BACT|nr:winged helix-turn-helix domain-containing protein [Fulvivirga lutea]QSE98043.1 winged helix-turn-helix domain-containing protein [Fulvivirga lutea]